MVLTRLIASAILTTLLSFGSACAENDEGWKWSVSGDEVQPYLVYEDAERQENRFILMCDNERRTADVSVPVTDKRARRGQSVVVELTVSGQTVTMTGRIATDNGVYARVRTAPYKALVALLRLSGPGTVATTGNTYMLGERGRARKLNSFASICKLKS